MRLLVHEYVTGGGAWSEGHAAPSGSLLREGSAMIGALLEDLLRIPAMEVVALRDCRLRSLAWPESTGIHHVDSAARERELLVELASVVDGAILIAPECHGALESRARLIAAAGGRLLSPDADFIHLAADKDQAACSLKSRGVPVPDGCLIEAGQTLPTSFQYPAVLKPVDGAGSWHVQYVAGPNSCIERPGNIPMRLETFHPGLAASVAVIRGPRHFILLPGCEQRLTPDGRFQYLGGRTPLPATLDRRAQQLAAFVVESLPPTVGYFGIDLVLAIDAGQRDVVIEVNPRLTTSYVGLRRLMRGNLAEAMLRIAHGKKLALTVDTKAIEFSADGG